MLEERCMPRGDAPLLAVAMSAGEREAFIAFRVNVSHPEGSAAAPCRPIAFSSLSACVPL
jgi:hypothetical protein